MGSRSPAFSPADLPGLALWLKADAITGLADGEAVATWLDSSGNGRDAAQATESKQPSYQTNELNGLPAVQTDGGDELLTPSITGLAALSVYFVVKSSTPNADYFLRCGSDSNAIIQGYTENKWEWFSDPRTDLGTLSTVAYKRFYTTVGSSVTSVWTLFNNASGAGTEFWTGLVCEIIAYGAAHSATESELVNDWLDAKYGL